MIGLLCVKICSAPNPQMERISYDVTVRSVLEVFAPDLSEICEDAEKLHQNLCRSLFERYDESFQPITIAVDLLVMPVLHFSNLQTSNSLIL